MVARIAGLIRLPLVAVVVFELLGGDRTLSLKETYDEPVCRDEVAVPRCAITSSAKPRMTPRSARAWSPIRRGS